MSKINFWIQRDQQSNMYSAKNTCKVYRPTASSKDKHS